MQEVEREEQRYRMVESYRSLVLNHFDNETEEVYFQGVKVDGKNEGYCEVLTSNYFFKGFFRRGEKCGEGVIQIKSDVHEPLGLEGIPGIKNRSVSAINRGGLTRPKAEQRRENRHLPRELRAQQAGGPRAPVDERPLGAALSKGGPRVPAQAPGDQL